MLIPVLIVEHEMMKSISLGSTSRRLRCFAFVEDRTQQLRDLIEAAKKNVK